MKRLVFVFLLLFSCQPSFVFAKTPNDPYANEQWYLSQISAPAAWNTTTGSSSVTIAVLDAGFDMDHPDLVDQYFINTGEIAGNEKDDDKNGYMDDVSGWDFIGEDQDPSPQTGSGSDAEAAEHGSLVAGLIDAEGNNEEGVAGVVWKAKILPLRVLDETGAGASDAASDAIDYAVAMGADVINMSFAGDAGDVAFRRSIERAYEAGVVVVAAMGNDGVNTSSHPVYPACFEAANEDWVIGVGATNEEDYRSLFSNYGPCTDLSAPGENIYGVSYQDDSGNFEEAYLGGWDGTSMAAPLVTGAVALLKSAYPELSPKDIRNILKLSVDPVHVKSTSMSDKVGAGRLNVDRALEYAASFATAKSSATPSSSGGIAPGSGVMGISPVTGAQEEVSMVTAGEFIKGPSYATVYYVSAEGERKVFMDASAYFTWSDSFDDVVQVTDATLPTLALTGVMLPKPGVVLVKIASDSTVYLIEENSDKPLLRAIVSESIAQEMFGSAWADYVIDIDPTYIARFEKGDDVTRAEAVDTSIMKTRAQLSGLAQ